MPRTVEALISDLLRRYPEPSHRPGVTLEQVMYEAGQRAVVVQLASDFELTRQKDLTYDVPR
jgi:hypothetical protein